MRPCKDPRARLFRIRGVLLDVLGSHLQAVASGRYPRERLTDAGVANSIAAPCPFLHIPGTLFDRKESVIHHAQVRGCPACQVAGLKAGIGNTTGHVERVVSTGIGTQVDVYGFFQDNNGISLFLGSAALGSDSLCSTDSVLQLLTFLARNITVGCFCLLNGGSELLTEVIAY